MYLLGLDIGSSSIKAAIIRVSDSKTLALVKQPNEEMPIISHAPGWAEQNPEEWWAYTKSAITQAIEEANIDGKDIRSIGISYQMHGLVLVDKDHEVLRPSIIWCDSRAVNIGQQAFQDLGTLFSLQNYLNSPGNFTASKLKWVQENEPHIYARIHKIMLPGDYINMKLTGEINTTISGLSEGVLWNFAEDRLATRLLDYYKIDTSQLPETTPCLSIQGTIRREVADLLGLSFNTTVSYRAGDQPNNAMSLGVLNPGEIAATGGTSGVVYGVADQNIHDEKSRVNVFAHVNHSTDHPRLGVLLCINGAGIQYAWMRKHLGGKDTRYEDMELMGQRVPIGSEGLMVMPFGNGAERMFENKDIGAKICNLQFSRHSNAHMYRASLEGIAFSFVYGCNLLKQIGVQPSTIRVGNDNLFQSQIFSNTIANVLDINIDVMKTSGAVGAAKASGVAIGVYSDINEAIAVNAIERQYNPGDNAEAYKDTYGNWQREINKILNN